VIDRDFLALLVCPVCKGPLEHVPATAGDGELLCRRCALAYPVRDGIPMLVREDARAIEAQPSSRRD
jgi:uncharacterized protein YbaR (Trm112 family)